MISVEMKIKKLLLGCPSAQGKTEPRGSMAVDVSFYFSLCQRQLQDLELQLGG